MIAIDTVDDSYGQGIQFIITNKDHLAIALALLFLQERYLAKQIINSDIDSIIDEVDDFIYEQSEIDDIVQNRLNVLDKSGKRNDTLIYHRDGLLFQNIMWLATHLDSDDNDIIAPPHVQRAETGQDLFIVHTTGNDIESVSICEDKATSNPRDTIRYKVWPEFEEYEKGNRRDEFRSKTISLLGTKNFSERDASRIVRKISWEEKRKYRARVTIEAPRGKDLFKGFPEIVIGDDSKRRGETLFIEDMRNWMEDLSQKIIIELNKYVRK